MNFLTLAVFGGFLFVSGSLRAAENYDLDLLRTTEGTVYRGIQILDADRHGLSFRHEAGIAKVLFSSLSPNLRMLYEVLDELPAAAPAGDAGVESEPPAISAPAAAEAKPPLPIVLTTASRVRIPAPAYSLGGGYVFPDVYGGPVRWGRNDPVYLLSQPYLREVAVRDFLYSSGLLPLPPGVSVRTFYR